MRCETSDLLVTMHNSDHRKSVWYENKRFHSLQQSARSVTGEDSDEDEEEEYVQLFCVESRR